MADEERKRDEDRSRDWDKRQDWDKDRDKDRDKKHKSFKDLVREAIADELAAVAMYSEMANMVKNPVLKAIIFSIAGDEYNHARTWMTILDLDP